jgi:hypothetical protein
MILVNKAGLQPYRDALEKLPFVKSAEFHRAHDVRLDAELVVKTQTKKFRFAVETKPSFLGRDTTERVIALAPSVRQREGVPLLLVAPYIPRPTGERLIDAGVDFVDKYGNVHIRLGNEFQAVILGRGIRERKTEKRITGPATAQVLFVFRANPDAINLPIRQLARLGGVSVGTATQVRKELLNLGVFHKTKRGLYQVTDTKLLTDRFLMGYEQLLRPKLVIGIYKPWQRNPELLLDEITDIAKKTVGKWALTGTAAAFKSQGFYRGHNTTIFVDELPPIMIEQLRLLPSATGPVTFLRTFGELVVDREIAHLPIANPWLVYAELRYDRDPRAQEAADMYWTKHLTNHD